MDEDFDIYGDLLDIETEAKQERLEVQVLEKKISELESKVLAKEQEKQEVVERNKILSENISSLLLTAKAELKRKDTIIADLRRQCEDSGFRHKTHYPREASRLTKSTQTNHIRNVHVGVQVEQTDSLVGHKDQDRCKDRQKDRDKEKHHTRDRDRDRNRERDRSQGLSRDRDKFRERDHYNDRHRDRERVHQRQWEADRTSDRYRDRNSTDHRNKSERHDDRHRSSHKDLNRKTEREQQKEYELDFTSGTKRTTQTEKHSKSDRIVMHDDETVHNKKKMAIQEKSTFAAVETELCQRSPLAQITDSPFAGIEAKPSISIGTKMHGETDALGELQSSVAKCSEPAIGSATIDDMGISAAKPVEKPVTKRSRKRQSIASTLLEQSPTTLDAPLMDNAAPLSTLDEMKSTAEELTNFRSEAEKFETGVNHQTDTQSNVNEQDAREDCRMYMGNPLVPESNIDEPSGVYEKMLDVCSIPQSIPMGDCVQQQATLGREATNDDFVPVSDVANNEHYLEHDFENAVKAHDKPDDSNVNVVLDNIQVVGAVRNETDSTLDGAIFEKPLDDIEMTEVTSDSVEVGDSAKVGQPSKSCKSKAKVEPVKFGKYNSISTDAVTIATNIFGTADKSSADNGITKTDDERVMEDVRHADSARAVGKYCDVQCVSIRDDHSSILKDRARKQESSFGAKNRLDTAKRSAGLKQRSISPMKEQSMPERNDVQSTHKLSNETTDHNSVRFSELTDSRAGFVSDIADACVTNDSTSTSPTANIAEPQETSIPKLSTEGTQNSQMIMPGLDATGPADSCQDQLGVRNRRISLDKDDSSFQGKDGEERNAVIAPVLNTADTQSKSKPQKSVKKPTRHYSINDNVTVTKQDYRNNGNANAAQSNTEGSGSIRDRLRKILSTDRRSLHTIPSNNKRRLSLDSSTTTHKKHKPENDHIDTSKQPTSPTLKLSDTFFSSIFLPIVSPLDNIHLKTEVSTDKETTSMPRIVNSIPMVVVHSPVKSEFPQQRTTDMMQTLMDSILSPVKNEDHTEVEDSQRCRFDEPSKVLNDLDDSHVSPGLLLASSTPLNVKPHSRLHHSTASVPIVSDIEGTRATVVPQTEKSTLRTAPEEHPPLCLAPCESSTKLVHCRNTEKSEKKQNRKQKAQKGGEVVDALEPNVLTNTQKLVHTQSGREGQICTPKKTLKRSPDRTAVPHTVTNYNDEHKVIDSSADVVRQREKHASGGDLPAGVFKTPDMLKSEKRLRHKSRDTLSLVSVSSPEVNHNSLPTMQDQSFETMNGPVGGTPLSTRKQRRVSPQRRKIVISRGGEVTKEVESTTVKTVKTHVLKTHVSVEAGSTTLIPTNLTARPRKASRKMNAEGNVDMAQNCRPKTKELPDNRELRNGKILTKDITVEEPSPSSSSSTNCFASFDLLSTAAGHMERSTLVNAKLANEIQPDLQRSVTSAEIEGIGQCGSSTRQHEETPAAVVPPVSAPATQRMCNFSLNMSLASAIVETNDSNKTEKAETPVRFVREMRIVRENPKLLRVYINRRGD